MKLTVTQIVLGAFAAAACYYVQMQVQTAVPWLEEDSQGNIQVIMVNAGAAIMAAHWLAVLTAGLGLAICIIGIIYLLRRQAAAPEGSKTLMEIGLVLAAALSLTSFLVNAWGFPTSLSRIMPDGRIATQFWGMSRGVAIAHLLAGMAFLSGLAILGCGLAGYLKMRRRNTSRLLEVEADRE
jgi:hypothetical protein